MYGVENSYICHSQYFIGGLGRQHASCFINSRRYSWVGKRAHMRARDSSLLLVRIMDALFQTRYFGSGALVLK